MGCAVHTMFPADVSYRILELKTNLLRPIAVETGLLLCEGRIVHVGGCIATAGVCLRGGQALRPRYNDLDDLPGVLLRALRWRAGGEED